MHTIERADLLDDPRFADWPSRLKNEAALLEVIYEIFAEEDAATWEARLIEGGVPCAQIQTIREAVEHPQLNHRKFMQTVEGPSGPVTLATTGFKLDHGNAELTRGFPELGEHAEEVLIESGFSEREIAELMKEGTI
jgi:crotonobetainyl-CoA:carnitine CoA-transferase CaiB-like acyl-CoA transferase